MCKCFNGNKNNFIVIVIVSLTGCLLKCKMCRYKSTKVLVVDIKNKLHRRI